MALATSTRSRAAMTRTRPPASTEPTVAPIRPPAPITAKARLAWAGSKACETSSQSWATPRVAISPVHTYSP